MRASIVRSPRVAGGIRNEVNGPGKEPKWINRPDMTDLRHGVTEIQHTVLDMLDPDSTHPLTRYDYEGQIYLAYSKAENAKQAVSLTAKRDFAMEAAAHFIAAAEYLDALLAVGDA